MSGQRTLAQKLLSVQKTIGALTKDNLNPFFTEKSGRRVSYADLNQALVVAKEALNKEGCFIVQGPGLNEFGRYIETSIIDADSGQSIVCRVPFSGSEKNMQEIGAATTYGRRFGLVSLLALEQEDDDGETAVGRGVKANIGKPTSNNAPSTQRSDTPSKTGSTDTPVRKEVPKGSNRKATNEKISLTSKVLIDSKRATREEIVTMLTAYGVNAKEELTDDQAEKLLNQLKEKLNK